MARLQILIPDDDRDRLVHRASKEGMTLSVVIRTFNQALGSVAGGSRGSGS